jgi:DUF2075 family protein
MKIKLLLLLLLINLSGFAQHYKACKTTEEVKKKLEGYWIIKESDSSKVYEYSFKDTIGFVCSYNKEAFKNHIKAERITVNSSNTVIVVKKGLFGFRFYFVSLSGTKKAKLKYIDDTKMILKSDGKTIEYTKLKL